MADEVVKDDPNKIASPSKPPRGLQQVTTHLKMVEALLVTLQGNPKLSFGEATLKDEWGLAEEQGS